MKRIAVTFLSLALTALVAACGSSNHSDSTATSPTGSVVTSTISRDTTDTAASPAAESHSEPTTDQVSEFDTPNSNPADNTTPLALKISETPAPAASRWKEGVHYKLLVPAQPNAAKPGQVDVTEVFWYGCPHCYALDPYLETWRKNGKASYVIFNRVPVMWGTLHRAHARVFYTAEILGKLDGLHNAIFNEIQVNRNPLQEPTQIQAFFTSKGVTQAEFQKAYASFAVETALKQAETLGLRYKVESVPLIIVNGKYITDVGQAGGHEQLISLINELASREHGV